MLKILLLCIALLFALHLWHKVSCIVRAYNIHPDPECEDIYICNFRWHWAEHEGYFYSEDEPDENIFVRVSGADCDAKQWVLRLCDDAQEQSSDNQ